jgi:Holliday junction resolvase-like predicted endonuclease
MEIGESLVGSYFKYIEGCKVVVYDTPLDGEQGDIDIIVLDETTEKVYICDVATHIQGLQYGNYDKTVKKLEEKIYRSAKFAKRNFNDKNVVFMIWSPRVPTGLEEKLTKLRKRIRNKVIEIDFVINKVYTDKIEQLKKKAKENASATNEPAFRLLQILEHLK